VKSSRQQKRLDSLCLFELGSWLDQALDCSKEGLISDMVAIDNLSCLDRSNEADLLLLNQIVKLSDHAAPNLETEFSDNADDT